MTNERRKEIEENNRRVLLKQGNCSRGTAKGKPPVIKTSNTL